MGASNETSAEQRRRRQAEALRANLHKRKAQARANRSQAEPKDPSKPGSGGDDGGAESGER